MCNACGFYCCAYDGFGQCGCEFCPEPECWPVDDDDMDDYEDDYDFACCRPAPRFICQEVPLPERRAIYQEARER